MLEKYLSPVLMSFLDKYVRNITPEDLGVSLWQGDVVLRNLELRLDVLERELKAPIRFQSGKIHELRLHVPWTKLASQPVEVTINTIEFIVTSRDADEHSAPPPAQKDGGEASHAPGMFGADATPDWQSDETSPGYISSLAQKIANNVSLRINNLILKFIEGDMVVSFSAKTIALRTTDGRWAPAFAEILLPNPALHRRLELFDVTLCVDRRGAAGKIDVYQDPLLYRTSLECRIRTRYDPATLLSPTGPSTTETRIDVHCGHLAWSVSDQQVPMLAALYNRFWDVYYAHQKPPVRPFKKHSSPGGEDRSDESSSGEDDDDNVDDEAAVSGTAEAHTSCVDGVAADDVGADAEKAADEEGGWMDWAWSVVAGDAPKGHPHRAHAHARSSAGGKAPSTLVLAIHVNRATIALKIMEAVRPGGYPGQTAHGHFASHAVDVGAAGASATTIAQLGRYLSRQIAVVVLAGIGVTISRTPLLLGVEMTIASARGEYEVAGHGYAQSFTTTPAAPASPTPAASDAFRQPFLSCGTRSAGDSERLRGSLFDSSGDANSTGSLNAETTGKGDDRSAPKAFDEALRMSYSAPLGAAKVRSRGGVRAEGAKIRLLVGSVSLLVDLPFSALIRAFASYAPPSGTLARLQSSRGDMQSRPDPRFLRKHVARIKRAIEKGAVREIHISVHGIHMTVPFADDLAAALLDGCVSQGKHSAHRPRAKKAHQAGTSAARGGLTAVTPGRTSVYDTDGESLPVRASPEIPAVVIVLPRLDAHVTNLSQVTPIGTHFASLLNAAPISAWVKAGAGHLVPQVCMETVVRITDLGFGVGLARVDAGGTIAFGGPNVRNVFISRPIAGSAFIRSSSLKPVWHDVSPSLDVRLEAPALVVSATSIHVSVVAGVLRSWTMGSAAQQALPSSGDRALLQSFTRTAVEMSLVQPSLPIEMVDLQVETIHARLCLTRLIAARSVSIGVASAAVVLGNTRRPLVSMHTWHGDDTHVPPRDAQAPQQPQEAPLLSLSVQVPRDWATADAESPFARAPFRPALFARVGALTLSWDPALCSWLAHAGSVVLPSVERHHATSTKAGRPSAAQARSARIRKNSGGFPARRSGGVIATHRDPLARLLAALPHAAPALHTSTPLVPRDRAADDSAAYSGTWQKARTFLVDVSIARVIVRADSGSTCAAVVLPAIVLRSAGDQLRQFADNGGEVPIVADEPARNLQPTMPWTLSVDGAAIWTQRTLPTGSTERRFILEPWSFDATLTAAVNTLRDSQQHAKAGAVSHNEFAVNTHVNVGPLSWILSQWQSETLLGTFTAAPDFLPAPLSIAFRALSARLSEGDLRSEDGSAPGAYGDNWESETVSSEGTGDETASGSSVRRAGSSWIGDVSLWVQCAAPRLGIVFLSDDSEESVEFAAEDSYISVDLDRGVLRTHVKVGTFLTTRRAGAAAASRMPLFGTEAVLFSSCDSQERFADGVVRADSAVGGVFEGGDPGPSASRPASPVRDTPQPPRAAFRAQGSSFISFSLVHNFMPTAAAEFMGDSRPLPGEVQISVRPFDVVLWGPSLALAVASTEPLLVGLRALLAADPGGQPDSSGGGLRSDGRHAGRSEHDGRGLDAGGANYVTVGLPALQLSCGRVRVFVPAVDGRGICLHVGSVAANSDPENAVSRTPLADDCAAAHVTGTRFSVASFSVTGEARSVFRDTQYVVDVSGIAVACCTPSDVRAVASREPLSLSPHSCTHELHGDQSHPAEFDSEPNPAHEWNMGARGIAAALPDGHAWIVAPFAVTTVLAPPVRDDPAVGPDGQTQWIYAAGVESSVRGDIACNITRDYVAYVAAVVRENLSWLGNRTAADGDPDKPRVRSRDRHRDSAGVPFELLVTCRKVRLSMFDSRPSPDAPLAPFVQFAVVQPIGSVRRVRGALPSAMFGCEDVAATMNDGSSAPPSVLSTSTSRNSRFSSDTQSERSPAFFSVHLAEAAVVIDVRKDVTVSLDDALVERVAAIVSAAVFAQHATSPRQQPGPSADEPEVSVPPTIARLSRVEFRTRQLEVVLSASSRSHSLSASLDSVHATLEPATISPSGGIPFLPGLNRVASAEVYGLAVRCRWPGSPQVSSCLDPCILRATADLAWTAVGGARILCVSARLSAGVVAVRLGKQSIDAVNCVVSALARAAKPASPVDSGNALPRDDLRAVASVPASSHQDRANCTVEPEAQPSQDDLRGGAFRFVFSETSRRPAVSEIVLVDTRASASRGKPSSDWPCSMTWRYSQARSLTSVHVTPVPFETAPEDEFARDLHVMCELRYYDAVREEFVPLQHFAVYQDAPARYDVGDAPAADEWQVLVNIPWALGHSDEYDTAVRAGVTGGGGENTVVGGGEASRGDKASNGRDGDESDVDGPRLSPLALIAAVRVDSKYCPSRAPRISIAAEIASLRVHLTNQAALPAGGWHGFAVPPSLFVHEQPLCDALLESVRLRGSLWRGGTAVVKVSSKLSLDTVCYRDLTRVAIVDPFEASAWVQSRPPVNGDGSRRVDAHVCCGIVAAQAGQTLLDLARASAQFWRSKPPVDPFLAHYVVCNSIHVPLRFGQVGTDESIGLDSLSACAYCWRTHRPGRTRAVHVSVGAGSDEWRWTDGLDIDAPGLRPLSLVWRGRRSVLWADVTRCDGPRRRIVLHGSHVLRNCLGVPLEYAVLQPQEARTPKHVTSVLPMDTIDAADVDTVSAEYCSGIVMPATQEEVSLLLPEDVSGWSVVVRAVGCLEWSEPIALGAVPPSDSVTSRSVCIPTEAGGALHACVSVAREHGEGVDGGVVACGETGPVRCAVWLVPPIVIENRTRCALAYELVGALAVDEAGGVSSNALVCAAAGSLGTRMAERATVCSVGSPGKTHAIRFRFLAENEHRQQLAWSPTLTLDPSPSSETLHGDAHYGRSVVVPHPSHTDGVELCVVTAPSYDLPGAVAVSLCTPWCVRNKSSAPIYVTAANLERGVLVPPHSRMLAHSFGPLFDTSAHHIRIGLVSRRQSIEADGPIVWSREFSATGHATEGNADGTGGAAQCSPSGAEMPAPDVPTEHVVDVVLPDAAWRFVVRVSGGDAGGCAGCGRVLVVCDAFVVVNCTDGLLRVRQEVPREVRVYAVPPKGLVALNGWPRLPMRDGAADPVSDGVAFAALIRVSFGDSIGDDPGTWEWGSAVDISRYTVREPYVVRSLVSGSRSLAYGTCDVGGVLHTLFFVNRSTLSILRNECPFPVAFAAGRTTQRSLLMPGGWCHHDVFTGPPPPTPHGAADVRRASAAASAPSSVGGEAQVGAEDGLAEDGVVRPARVVLEVSPVRDGPSSPRDVLASVDLCAVGRQPVGAGVVAIVTRRSLGTTVTFCLDAAGLGTEGCDAPPRGPILNVSAAIAGIALSLFDDSVGWRRGTMRADSSSTRAPPQASGGSYARQQSTQALSTELVRISLDGVSVSLGRTRDTGLNCGEIVRTVTVTVDGVQVDNQLLDSECEFPVVLYADLSGLQLGPDGPSKALSLTVVSTEAPPGGDERSVFRRVVLRAAPIVINIEDKFVFRLKEAVDVLADLTSTEHYLASAARNSSVDVPPFAEAAGNGGGAGPGTRGDDGDADESVSPGMIRAVCREPLSIDALDIGPLEAIVSVRTSFRLHIGVDHTPLSFSTLRLSRVFCDPSLLLETLAAHYAFEAVIRAPSLIGSLELLGNPTGLVFSVSTGLRDLVVMPLSGMRAGPVAFISGVGGGAASFVRHVGAGALSSIASLTSGIARNLDRLAMDDTHEQWRRNARKDRPMHAAQGLGKGMLALGFGILGGIAGLVDQPVQAITRSSEAGAGVGSTAMDLAAGVGKGLLGCIAKPVGGAFELVAATSQGILQGAGVRPVPPPKMPPADDPLPPRPNCALKYAWKMLGTPNAWMDVIEVSAVGSSGQKHPGALVLATESLFFVSDSEDAIQQSLSVADIVAVDTSDPNPSLLAVVVVARGGAHGGEPSSQHQQQHQQQQSGGVPTQRRDSVHATPSAKGYNRRVVPQRESVSAFDTLLAGGIAGVGRQSSSGSRGQRGSSGPVAGGTAQRSVDSPRRPSLGHARFEFVVSPAIRETFADRLWTRAVDAHGQRDARRDPSARLF